MSEHECWFTQVQEGALFSTSIGECFGFFCGIAVSFVEYVGKKLLITAIGYIDVIGVGCEGDEKLKACFKVEKVFFVGFFGGGDG